MPPPIVPAPSTPTRLDVEDRCVLGDVGDLVRRPLGEERVALGGRLCTGHQFDEQLVLHLEALVERQVGGRLDAADVVLGGEEPAAFLAIERRKLVNSSVSPFAAAELVVPVADLLQRQLFGDGALGEGDRSGAEPARSSCTVTSSISPLSSASELLM